jgi:hypothetical protein
VQQLDAPVHAGSADDPSAALTVVEQGVEPIVEPVVERGLSVWPA